MNEKKYCLVSGVLASLTLPIVFTLALAAGSAQAQAVVERKALTLEGAKKVVATVEAAAAARHYPVAVAVADDAGNLIMMERIGDVQSASVNFCIGKAHTAAMFRRTTQSLEDVIHNGRTAFVALPDFTPLGGGVPLMSGDSVIGAVGVSGAAAPMDLQLADAGAAALMATSSGPAKAMTGNTPAALNAAALNVTTTTAPRTRKVAAR